MNKKQREALGRELTKLSRQADMYEARYESYRDAGDKERAAVANKQCQAAYDKLDLLTRVVLDILGYCIEWSGEDLGYATVVRKEKEK